MTTTTTPATATAAQAAPTLEAFAERFSAIEKRRSDLPRVTEISSADQPAHYRALAALETAHADLLYEVYQASARVLPNLMLHIAVSDSIEAHRRRADELQQLAAKYEQLVAELQQLQAVPSGGER